MTEPPFGGAESTPPPLGPPAYYRPPPGQFPPPAGQFPPPPPQYPPPPGHFPPPLNFPPPMPYPALGFYPDPAAPFGRHSFSGEPLSAKSKVVAGLLQLLGLFGFLGIGRIYLGYTGFGIAQLLGGLTIGVLTCGIGFIVPVVWGIIDAVLIFSDRVRDPEGRPLRDDV